MIKYESRKQKREVTEFLCSILLPLKDYVKPENKESIEVAIRVLLNTDIEGDKNE